jgi:predicted acyltransferase
MSRAESASPRLMSLDAFRGLVMVVMFLVNVAGNDPAFPSWFPHRGWADGQMGNGLADFVFPCFLFIVGASVPFSMQAGRGKDRGTARRILAAFFRAVRIYLMGSVLLAASAAYKNPIDLSILARWDILPLIGFAYLIAVLCGFLPRWTQVAFIAAILILKWAILTQLKIPGKETVIWTATESYQAYLRGSLGWFGTAITQGLPAAAVAMLGSLAGRELLADSTRTLAPVKVLAMRGVVMIAASYLWHRWGGLPYSKDFFTSSYVLVASGVSCVLLAGLYWLIDLRKLSTLAPLRHLGTNAFAIYFLAEFLWRTSMMQWKVVTPDGGSSLLITALKAWLQHATTVPIGSWLLVLSYIAFYWAVSYLLYRKNWFIKV